VVWLDDDDDDDDDVELVDTVAAEQAPVTDGTALTPELTGMMFDPCNIVSNFGPIDIRRSTNAAICGDLEPNMRQKRLEIFK